MSWARPSIGSRVNREVHARFWERLGVKLPRATRHSTLALTAARYGHLLPSPDDTDVLATGERALMSA